MLNIEKYKEMLIDEDVINVDNLAIVKNNPTNCTGQCAECDFRKTVFLTKSEAEAKLEELRGNNE